MKEYLLGEALTNFSNAKLLFDLRNEGRVTSANDVLASIAVIGDKGIKTLVNELRTVKSIASSWFNGRWNCEICKFKNERLPIDSTGEGTITFCRSQ